MEKLKNKKLLIGIVFGLLIIIIIILLLFSNSNNKIESKTMNCSMSLPKNEVFDIDIKMEAHYTDKIDVLEGSIKYDVISEELKQNIDELEQSIRASLKNNSIVVSISRQNNIITINYYIDYNNLKEDDAKKLGLDLKKDSTIITKEELEKEINSNNGSCVEN